MKSYRQEIPGYGLLEKLALNLRSSWNHSADKVWQKLDSDLWEFTHNPWVVLQTVSIEKLEAALADRSFRNIVEELVKIREEESKTSVWFQQNYPKSPLSCVAYFSMEFMLSEALPIYSGGLGNVAGDQLKAANDLGVPIVAVGLLYQQGYFRQIIDAEGEQQEFFPYNEPGQLPITPLRKPNGEWLRLMIHLPGWPVWLRAWEVQVGRCKLYLLDSNDAANYPAHRGITSELYVSNIESRFKQEMMLGIGGWRLLNALGIEPEVCHLNEGHAALAVLERANLYMQKTKQPFDTAFATTRAGNLFTTHTAVPEGFDLISPDLIEKYLGSYAQSQLGISVDELLSLGRLNTHNSEEDFNMAYLAIRGSCAVNGVSRLHEAVSRRIFDPLFPRWPRNEIPVGHITNGVHTPSWDSAAADDLWTKLCGKCRWMGMTAEKMEEKMRGVSDEAIWKMRNESREKLIEYARLLQFKQLAAQGAPQKEIERAKHLFDPNVLTLGFARRFVPYKRPNLLLYDLERLFNILNNADRPVQLFIAGKAHPADIEGKKLIHEWMEFIKQDDVCARVVFLGDYDMLITEHLVQGVDVWLNTPRRPWEASGTSGMKVLVNGVLNCSELDGWWAEAYSPDVGWAIGDGLEHDHNEAWDGHEARELYDLLEREIVPLFYQRNAMGLPTEWIKRIRESMARLTPRFSASRAVCEYTDKYYIPAAAAYRNRMKDDSALGVQISRWRQSIERNWSGVKFVQMVAETRQDRHYFEAHIDLGQIDPDAIKVELFSEGVHSQIIEMPRQKAKENSTWVYRLSMPANCPISDYTLRVVPYHSNAFVPLEAPQILWQR